MSKHTKGPWTASGRDVFGRASDQLSARVCCLDVYPEAEADARLIAAAPDLLAAAKRVLADLNERDDDSLAFVRIGLDKAIAKAEGRD